jgi:preprotein translocase subunit SecE
VSTPDDAAKDDVANTDEGKQDPPASTTAAKENSKPAKKKSRTKKADKPGLFARFALFLRQVAAELRKVIWPTRSELINYTTVVLIFVVIMALILAVYDFAFARAVFFVFGN